MKLGLVEYFKYLDAGLNSRSVSEGEAVFNAGHVILCGKVSTNTQATEIFALCLQTSALSGDPHEIKGEILKGNNLTIKYMICSCKAGKSGKCKHISAVLLFCTREDIEDLELISKTDVKCMWSAQKRKTQEAYKAIPVQNMQCLNEKWVPMPELTSSEDYILNKFVCALQNSALALHKNGRRKFLIDTNVEETDHGWEAMVLNNACQSIIMLELSAYAVDFNNACCADKYDELFQHSNVESTIFLNQYSSDWFKERKYRITGSRIYEIYTYSQNNWRKKALNYFHPKSFSNKYLKHGIKYEKEARREFAKKSNKTIIESGLVICNNNVWLGFSPDGIIFDENQPAALIEIKCIFAGSTTTIREAIQNVNFLNVHNNKIELKIKHKYYGQIQLLGMALLNLTKSYFIIYASFDKTMEVLEIPFNYEFSKSMLQKVKLNLIKNMIPYICCT